MSCESNGIDRRVACFEVVTPTEFGTDYFFNPLIRETETQRRLAFLAERTLGIIYESNL